MPASLPGRKGLLMARDLGEQLSRGGGQLRSARLLNSLRGPWGPGVRGRRGHVSWWTRPWPAWPGFPTTRGIPPRPPFPRPKHASQLRGLEGREEPDAQIQPLLSVSAEGGSESSKNWVKMAGLYPSYLPKPSARAGFHAEFSSLIPLC